MTMKFEWNDETIRYFKNASEYTEYHQKLGELIKPQLSPTKTLADIGCGLGLLDLAIADNVKSIDAIDINDAPIASLKKDVNARNIKNITPIVDDIDRIENCLWDIVLLSYFGRPDEQFLRVIRFAKEKVIMIRHGETVIGDDRPDAVTMSNFLKENKIKHEYKVIDLEFGQPFTSTEDAQRFFEIYTYDQGADQLVKTSNEKYPLYYPKKKSIALFNIF